MRIKNLEELRNIHCEINNKQSREGETLILNAVNEMLKLNRIARLEGLLALEEAVIDIPTDSEKELLKQLIILLVDGTEPEIIQGIGFARYYAGLYTGYQALKYLIYLEGTLSIQAGDNPSILEEKLKSMLPPALYYEYSLKREQAQIEETRKKEENLIESLCKAERLWNTGENGYYVLKLTDYVICDITDKELQRVLRDVDNMELVLAMRGMSGKARKHIFDNLSERLGKLVAQDMTAIGPVRAADILEASQKILAVIIRLIEQYEISNRYEYLEPFYQVVSVDTKAARQKQDKISELKEMITEYEKGAELVREIE